MTVGRNDYLTLGTVRWVVLGRHERRRRWGQPPQGGGPGGDFPGAGACGSPNLQVLERRCQPRVLEQAALKLPALVRVEARGLAWSRCVELICPPNANEGGAGLTYKVGPAAGKCGLA